MGNVIPSTSITPQTLAETKNLFSESARCLNDLNVDGALWSALSIAKKVILLCEIEHASSIDEKCPSNPTPTFAVPRVTLSLIPAQLRDSLLEFHIAICTWLETAVRANPSAKKANEIMSLCLLAFACGIGADERVNDFSVFQSYFLASIAYVGTHQLSIIEQQNVSPNEYSKALSLIFDDCEFILSRFCSHINSYFDVVLKTASLNDVLKKYFTNLLLEAISIIESVNESALDYAKSIIRLFVKSSELEDISANVAFLGTEQIIVPLNQIAESFQNYALHTIFIEKKISEIKKHSALDIKEFEKLKADKDQKVQLQKIEKSQKLEAEKRKNYHLMKQTMKEKMKSDAGKHSSLTEQIMRELEQQHTQLFEQKTVLDFEKSTKQSLYEDLYQKKLDADQTVAQLSFNLSNCQKTFAQRKQIAEENYNKAYSSLLSSLQTQRTQILSATFSDLDSDLDSGLTLDEFLQKEIELRNELTEKHNHEKNSLAIEEKQTVDEIGKSIKENSEKLSLLNTEVDEITKIIKSYLQQLDELDSQLKQNEKEISEVLKQSETIENVNEDDDTFSALVEKMINESNESIDMIFTQLAFHFCSLQSQFLILSFSRAIEAEIKSVRDYFSDLISPSSPKPIKVQKVTEFSDCCTMVDECSLFCNKSLQRAISTANLICTQKTISEICEHIHNDLMKAFSEELEVHGGDVTHLKEFLILLNNNDAMSNNLKDIRALAIKSSLTYSSEFQSQIRSQLGSFSKVCEHLHTFLNTQMNRVSLFAVEEINWLFPLFLRTDYNINEEVYASYQINDPFVNNVISAIESVLPNFYPSLSQNCQKVFLQNIVREILKRIEANVLQKSFSLLGGLQLNQDLNVFIKYLTEKNVFENSLFSRMKQIAFLLSLDSVSDAHLADDTLSVSLARSVLARRTDFSVYDVLSLTETKVEKNSNKN